MNPRIKKIGRNILFLLSIPGIVGAFVFAQSEPQEQKLKGIEVEIQNTRISFITKQDVLAMMEKKGLRIGESALNTIAIDQLETALRNNPWVSDAELYLTAGHALHIRLEQREPVARIAYTDENQSEYYLDRNADPIPLSDQYIAKVPVVTAPVLGYTVDELRLKRQLAELSMYIRNDSFWNDMITQVYVNEQHEIQLIPVLGEQVIRLGSTANLADKMNRLLSFYRKGMATIDWNRYNEIDLRFARQIVARNTNVAMLKDDELEKQMLEMKLAAATPSTLNTRAAKTGRQQASIPKPARNEKATALVTKIKQ